ncbi:efflux RND transporter periplasmic adaptor subunit [Humisphaera borealis]|uniref:Efflux RND transporter periplasmic adaptor subunit n=1 Tax=Humisphaera borealis TaxID=2807512 RepID=A0A7M2WRD7_9BACT|nr:efflux RND transporter periplasmic adaptor subunit [Humisphaera borealis]QOV87814.1 efflux RND transporter periplasmic adaptor subunit [Humisphaera borealis]
MLAPRRKLSTVNKSRLAALSLAMVAMTGGLGLQSSVALGQSSPGSAESMLTSHERGVTKPKEEPKLAFVGPGVVMKVLVKEGATVTKDQVLAVQDDRDETGKLEVAKGEVESARMQIEAAAADLELKKVTLARLEELYADLIKQPAPKNTNRDLDEARVAVKIAEISIKFRETEWNKAKLEQHLQQIRLDQKKLVSPIDGVISKIDVNPGEGTDLSRPAMQIVQIDTLKVEVDIQATKCKALKIGDTLQVRYTDEDKWMPATITFMTKYANASSGTRKVRLEMKNEADREAGLPVYVKLPDNLAAVTR